MYNWFAHVNIEQYRVVQDTLYESDFDRLLKEYHEC